MQWGLALDWSWGIFVFCFKSLKTAFFYLTICLYVASCGVETSNPQRPLIGPRPQFNANAIGSCSTLPTSGESAHSQSQDSTFVDSGYFAKSFRRQSFLQALKASSVEVINWLYDQGVQVLKIETQSKSECRYFGFLNKANNEYQNIWEENGGSDSVSGEQLLLGLFRTLLQRPSGGGPAQLVSPTILLRDDTDRWTLLHEKTHFLFAQGRIQDPNMVFIETLREDNRTLYRKLRSQELQYLKKNQTQLALQILETFSDYLKVNQELFQRGPLEEFSIESLLANQVQEKNTQGLNSTEGLLNALANMKSNAEPVLTSYKTLVRKLQNYQGDFFQKEPQSIHEQAGDLETSLQGEVDFITEKIDILQSYLEQIGERNFIEPRQLLDHSHYNFDILKEQIELIESLNLSHTGDTHNTFDL